MSEDPPAFNGLYAQGQENLLWTKHPRVLSLTLLDMFIGRNPSDVPAHRSAVIRHAGVAISKPDSFALLGMTTVRFIVGQDARSPWVTRQDLILNPRHSML